MGASELLGLAGQFGPMGLFVGYLIWRELRNEKLSRDRIETDKSIATAMALLTAAINGMRS
jgi:hypothetical protein